MKHFKDVIMGNITTDKYKLSTISKLQEKNNRTLAIHKSSQELSHTTYNFNTSSYLDKQLQLTFSLLAEIVFV